jgi:ABC-type uncharacterized transport system permease subunit
MHDILSVLSLNLLMSTIRLTTPILLAALAAALCNKAGVLNLAIEGEMLLGSFVAIVVTYCLNKYTPLGVVNPTLSTYLGVVVSILFGGVLGVLMAWLHTKWGVDLVIFSIAFNMLASEITVFLMRAVFHQNGTWTDSSIVQLPTLAGGYNIIVYASWICVIFCMILYRATRFGRHLKAVGEAPEAAASVGISVRNVQYIALIAGGALSTLGGSFLSVGHLTLFTRDMAAGRGWLGNAAALFGFNNPGGTFLASLFFGFADALALRLQNVTKIPPYMIQVMPYVLTLMILGFVSWRAQKNAQKYQL